MRHKKIEHVPASTREVDDFTTCDLCKATLKSDLYAVDEVEVERRKGTKYPEQTDLTVTYVDICPACFDAKLLPWLRAQGAEPQTRKIEF
jgi:hypothetical protein